MPLRLEPLTELRPAERTPEGILKAQGRLARVGVQAYRQRDGTVRRELRPPEEVFSPRALASLELAPLTVMHPTSGTVTPETAPSLMVGAVAAPKDSGDGWLTANVAIHTQAGLDAVQAGLDGLSVGYDVDLDPTPGVWNGIPYTHIQRNIRAHHVAIVPLGRAGDDARLRLDAADEQAAQAQPQATPEEKKLDTVPERKEKRHMPTKLVRLDGADVEVDAQIAPAIERTTARLDALAEQVTKLTADLAAQRAAIPGLAAERAALLAQAQSALPEGRRLDSALSNQDIKRQVLAQLRPAWDLTGKSDEHVDARYEVALDLLAQERAAHASAAAKPAAGAGSERRLDGADKPSASELAYQAHLAKYRPAARVKKEQA